MVGVGDYVMRGRDGRFTARRFGYTANGCPDEEYEIEAANFYALRSQYSSTANTAPEPLAEERMQKAFFDIAKVMSRSKGAFYLASPYQNYLKDTTCLPEKVRHQIAWIDVTRIAAALLVARIPVFSPIAHSHPISTAGAHNLSHGEWMDLDYHFLDASIGLIVAEMPGWDESTGVKLEIQRAKDRGLPVINLPVDPSLLSA